MGYCVTRSRVMDLFHRPQLPATCDVGKAENPLPLPAINPFPDKSEDTNPTQTSGPWASHS